MEEQKHEKYAGFWLRFKASLIDFGILFPLFFIFVADDVFNSTHSTYTASLAGIDYLMLTVFFIFYELIMYVEYNGQTVGKRVCNIRLITDDNSKLTYGKVMLRIIGGYISTAVFFLGYFNIIWSKKKQAWHDKIAKTYVIKI